MLSFGVVVSFLFGLIFRAHSERTRIVTWFLVDSGLKSRETDFRDFSYWGDTWGCWGIPGDTKGYRGTTGDTREYPWVLGGYLVDTWG